MPKTKNSRATNHRRKKTLRSVPRRDPHHHHTVSWMCAVHLGGMHQEIATRNVYEPYCCNARTNYQAGLAGGQGRRWPWAATRPLPPSPQGPPTQRFPPFPQGQPHGTPRRQTPKENLIASDVETPAPTPNSQSAIDRQLIEISIIEPGIIDTTQEPPSCTAQRSGDIEPGETQRHNRATTHAAQPRSDLPPRS